MGSADSTSLTDFFDGYMDQFGDTNFISPAAVSSQDIFSELEVVLEGEFTSTAPPKSSRFNAQEVHDQSRVCHKRSSDSTVNSPKRKRQKASSWVKDNSNGPHKVAHITVERNRRKQMNQHLNVLRSLLPSFYVKRGDQASIIGVVVDYITELQQVLQSLEAKKQRKVYSNDVLSPRPSPLSPQKPPLSPRPLLPISPITPQTAVSPYIARLQQPAFYSYSNFCLQQPSSMCNYMITPPSPSSSSSVNSEIVNELVANSRTATADVEVKFCGSNLLLKTISRRFPGQATKIVSVLEDLSLEILEAGVNTVDETMVNAFTIKIGIECRLSAEDLVQHIQDTFS